MPMFLVTNHSIEKRLDEEAAAREAKRKEREEQHLYLPVRVLTEETFKNHPGTDLTSFESNPAEDPAAPRHYKMRSKPPWKKLYQ